MKIVRGISAPRAIADCNKPHINAPISSLHREFDSFDLDTFLQAISMAGTSADDPEFLRLVTSHQRKLYAFVMSLMHDHHDADEVLQQANVVMWEKASEFELGTEFMSWAGRIAYLQALAFRTQRRRRRWLLDETLLSQLASEAIERLDDLDERREALQRCLERLKPSQRALVVKRYYEPTAVIELAQELSRSPAAVCESLRRIRFQLGSCISRQLASGDST